jgi:aryl-alcohol dehydrogenase-like predicted oxidoreductase
VTSPIVGVTKPQHLADAVRAVDLDLSGDQLEMLAAPYQPHAVSGHR